LLLFERTVQSVMLKQLDGSDSCDFDGLLFANNQPREASMLELQQF